MKRLRCWSEPLLVRLKAEFRRRMLHDLGEYVLVAGWLLLAGDGSRCAVPRTQSNQPRFAPSKKAKKKARKGRTRKREKQLRAQRRRRKKQSQADRTNKAETPQIWVTVLYAVGLGLPWNWRKGPSDSSEREHLSEMARELPSHALVALDAGFVGYEFWKTLSDAEITFVGRVGGNVKLLKDLGYVRRRRNIVYVWPDKARRQEQPPQVLRLECFSGGKEMVYLVTNELDDKRLPQKDLIAIYAARWGVEIFYRDLKQTFERGKLRSKSASNAELELDWSLMGLWAMNLYASYEHIAAGVAPNRRSVANVLRAFRRSMQEYKSNPDEDEDLWSLLAKACKDNYKRKSSKISRNYPRKTTKHAISQPKIVLATLEQIQAARELKNTMKAAA